MTRRGRLRGVVAVLAGALLLTGLPAGAGTADDGDGNGAGGTITGTVTDDRGTRSAVSTPRSRPWSTTSTP